MIDLEHARAIAVGLIEQLAPDMGVDLALDDAATREESWCWVFFFNSRAYLKTGLFSEALAGNGPIVVEKEAGTVHQLVAARPVDVQLDEIRHAE